jgi:glucosylglycerate synthase
MASTSTNIAASIDVAPASMGSLLVSLTPLPPEALDAVLANLALAFPSETVLVATPDAAPTLSSGSPLRLLPYAATTSSTTNWVLNAFDYINANRLTEEHQASACVLLGPEPQSLHPEAIRALAAAATTSDLATAHYDIGPREGLVNSAILYPVTRALYATRTRFPLAVDLGLSTRMAARMAAAAQRATSSNQTDALVWPVAEAVIANYSITEVDVGTRTFLQPAVVDLNSVLTLIAGSLFADIDAKAAYWQRTRYIQPQRTFNRISPAEESHPDITSMLEAFQLAYSNLHEIWSLVLPPNSLLGIKKLSILPPDSFRMPDTLWARIVYDFILAYRMRTINRGHLLGALTPLYLAWTASHLLLTSSGTPPEEHIESLAQAFETDKPYLVSRWRWPDRFNP